MAAASPLRRTTPAKGIVLKARRRVINVYTVTEDEIVSLTEAGSLNALNMAFFGITFGAFISLLLTVVTANIANPRTYACFVMTTWGSGILALGFAMRVYLDRRRIAKKVRELHEASAA